MRLLALLLLLAAATLPGTARACSCVALASAADLAAKTARADAVFRGVVVQTGGWLGWLLGQRTAVFAVERVWTGPRQARLVVWTPDIHDGLCGWTPEAGWRGVIFARHALGGRLSTGACGQSGYYHWDYRARSDDDGPLPEPEADE